MLSRLSFLSILLLAITTFAYPTKPGSCLINGISGGHGQNYAPACPNCYYFTLTKSTSPPSGASGNTWNVVLNGPNPVKGLIMWVFDSNTNGRFGSWITYPTYTGPLATCGGINPQSNTLGHTSSQFKKMPVNLVWSDLGYTSSKPPSKRSLGMLDDKLFEGTRPGMREEIERELEKRAMINPGTVIPQSAIPAPPSGTYITPSTTPTKSASAATSSAVTPSTTKSTTGSGSGGTNNTSSSPGAWAGTMLGLVVVDFSDWYFITRVNFNANMVSAGGIVTNSTSGGGTNSTSGGGTTTGSGSGTGSGSDSGNGDTDGDGDGDSTSDGGLFIVGPSDILSKSHMLITAITLSVVFFLSGWGVEAFIMAQERKVRSFAKKWKT